MRGLHAGVLPKHHAALCRLAVPGLQVLVPVPDYTAKCTILVTTGKAKYDATKKAIVSPQLLLTR